MKVLGAQNREKKGLLGRSDPYVKLIMSDDRLPSKKTTVKRSNLNPEWNEDFKFVVIDLENQSLDVNLQLGTGMASFVHDVRSSFFSHTLPNTPSNGCI